MFSFISDNVFFKLLAHADWLSQLIFYGLIGMSIACWWIFMYKISTLNAKLSQLRYTRTRLQTVTSLEELAHFGALLHQSLAGTMINTTLTAVRKFTTNNTLKPVDQEAIKLSLDQSLHDMIKQEERFVSVTRLSAETGPLIGLFGTIWGLIHAFNRISERQTADIPTVAPGIAEALIVTLTGLFVAIPALIQYYIIMKKISVLEQELMMLADRIEIIIQKGLPTASSEWGVFNESTTQQQTK
jgi:biopolymer transport protein TolQ